jgi:hypothetical protein
MIIQDFKLFPEVLGAYLMKYPINNGNVGNVSFILLVL